MIEPTDMQVEIAYRIIQQEIGLPEPIEPGLYLPDPDLAGDKEKADAIRRIREEEERFRNQDRNAIRTALRAAMNHKE